MTLFLPFAERRRSTEEWLGVLRLKWRRLIPFSPSIIFTSFIPSSTAHTQVKVVPRTAGRSAEDRRTAWRGRNNRLIPPLPKNKQLNDGGMKRMDKRWMFNYGVCVSMRSCAKTWRPIAYICTEETAGTHILNTSHLHLRELKDYTFYRSWCDFKLFLISVVIQI